VRCGTWGLCLIMLLAVSRSRAGWVYQERLPLLAQEQHLMFARQTSQCKIRGWWVRYIYVYVWCC